MHRLGRRAFLRERQRRVSGSCGTPTGRAVPSRRRDATLKTPPAFPSGCRRCTWLANCFTAKGSWTFATSRDNTQTATSAMKRAADLGLSFATPLIGRSTRCRIRHGRWVHAGCFVLFRIASTQRPRFEGQVYPFRSGHSRSHGCTASMAAYGGSIRQRSSRTRSTKRSTRSGRQGRHNHNFSARAGAFAKKSVTSSSTARSIGPGRNTSAAC